MTRRRYLAVSVAVLAVFLSAGLLFSLVRQPADLATEAGFARLTDPGLGLDQVRAVKLYFGEAGTEYLLLAKPHDAWLVVSHYNAPAAAARVEKALKELVGLSGEFRADEPSVLKDFELTDQQALHIELYKKARPVGKPAAHLLAGLGQAGGGFTRRAGESAVYHVPVDLRSLMGLRGQALAKRRPEPDFWLDKSVLNIKKDDITGFEITMPDKKLVFEVEQGAGGKAVHLKNAPKGLVARQEVLDSLPGFIASLTASEVVDPELKAQYGLEKPTRRLQLELAGGGRMVLLGGRPAGTNNTYCLVQGREGVVYQAWTAQFNRVFAPLAQWFYLESGYDINPEDIVSIRYDTPRLKAEINNENGRFALTSPVIGLAPRPEVAQEAAKTLALWKPVDFAQDQLGHGLDAPAGSIAFTTRDGRERAVEIGAAALNTGGRYVRVKGVEAPGVMVMQTRDYHVICPELKEFFVNQLFEFAPASVSAVELGKAGQRVLLRQTGEAWVHQLGKRRGKAGPPELVARLLGTICGLHIQAAQAETADITLKSRSWDYIRLTLENEPAVHCFLGPVEPGGARPIRIIGKRGIFTIPYEFVDQLAEIERGLF